MGCDIRHEQKFLDMLGYKPVLHTENKWTILDDKECPVGFMERKIRFRKNKKKGLPAAYQYTINIESETVSYSNTRIEDRDGLYYYEFYIKDKKGGLPHFVNLDCGIDPSISISSELGLDSIGIDYKGLHCSFISKTKNYNVEEIIVYRDEKLSGLPSMEYYYQINYCKKDKDLDDINCKGITSRSITATSSDRYSDCITLSTMTYRNNKLRYSNEQDMSGTVDEAVIKNEMGIEAISHLRYRLNKILPFKEEVFESIFKGKRYLKAAGGHLFFPDIMENRRIEHKRKIKEKQKNDKKRINYNP